jgi:hypothetical protein
MRFLITERSEVTLDYLKLNGIRGAFRLGQFLLASIRANPVGLKNGLKMLISR